MVLPLIFRKLGLKQDRKKMTAIYAGFYFLLSLAILSAANLWLNRYSLLTILGISAAIGLAMGVSYLIRLETMRIMSRR